MKKKILAVTVAMLMMVTFGGCNSINNENDTDSSVTSEPDYECYRTGVCEGEDGWMYIVDIYEMSKGKYEYHIDANNYKHDIIPNCGIMVWNDNPEDVEIMPDNPPSKGQIAEAAEEIDRLEQYLDKMQFIEPININDLKEIELEYFIKEYVVEAFNNAINDTCWLSAEKNSRINVDYPYANTVHKRLSDGSRLSVGFCRIAGTVKYVYIGLEYKDGTFLKDNIVNNTASEQEKKLYAVMKKIEDKYIEKNRFDIKSQLEDIDWEENETMLTLSKIIDEIADKSWSENWEV